MGIFDFLKPSKTMDSTIIPLIEHESDVVDWLLKYDPEIEDLRRKFPEGLDTTKNAVLRKLAENSNSQSLKAEFIKLNQVWHQELVPKAIALYERHGNTVPDPRNNREDYEMLFYESLASAMTRILGYFLLKKYDINPKSLLKE